MANVVFIENDLRIDKLGIMQLSAVLKEAGHSVRLLQDKIDNIDLYFRDHQVDFAMYSVMTGEHKWFFDKNAELKRKFNFVSVFGGPHITFFPEQKAYDENIDFLVIGPGEMVIEDIVAGRHTKKIVMGSIPDLNTIPYADRSILYGYDNFRDAGIRRFIAARDCKNACAYCFNHSYHKMYKCEKNKFFAHVDPCRLIDEIDFIQQKYGLSLVYFNDDNLAQNIDWLTEFCERYKKEIGLPFCGSVRADYVDSSILSMMSSAGCNFLNIALESAVPETQKLLRRGTITNKQVADAVNTCEIFGIKVRLQNMIGLPVTNPLEDALITYQYNQKLRPTDSWVSIFQPFPGTAIHKYCLDNKFIDENKECMNFYDDTILNIPNAEKINTLHKWWHFGIKHNISREFMEILLEVGLTQKMKEKVQDMRWKLAAKELYGAK